MLKRWQAVCNTVPDLADLEFEIQTSRTRGTRVNHTNHRGGEAKVKNAFRKLTFNYGV